LANEAAFEMSPPSAAGAVADEELKEGFNAVLDSLRMTGVLEKMDERREKTIVESGGGGTRVV